MQRVPESPALAYCTAFPVWSFVRSGRKHGAKQFLTAAVEFMLIVRRPCGSGTPRFERFVTPLGGKRSPPFQAISGQWHRAPASGRSLAAHVVRVEVLCSANVQPVAADDWVRPRHFAAVGGVVQ